MGDPTLTPPGRRLARRGRVASHAEEVYIINGVEFLGEPLFPFDVTSSLISHIQGGEQFIGFTIRQREEILNSSVDFFPGHQLIVTIPEPSTAALLTFGLVGIGLRRLLMR